MTDIVGEPRIEVDKDREEDVGRPRELAWLLDLPGQDQVTPPKWHPRLVLREPDIEDQTELRFVQTHGAVLLKLRCALVRMGASRPRRIPECEISLRPV